MSEKKRNFLKFIKSGTYTDKSGNRTNTDRAASRVKKIDLDLETMKPASTKKMLTGGQAKIAAKAPPPNKIDEKDFAVLRAEKAKGRGMGLQDEKVQPGKIYKAKTGSGLDLPVINSVKPTVNKTKRAQNLSRMKIQFTKQKNRAGINSDTLDKILSKTKNPYSDLKATTAKGPKNYMKTIGVFPKVSGSKFTERRMKLKGPFSSMAEMRTAKGFKTINGKQETASEFNKRRMKLAGAARKALKATRIGKIALGVGAAGVAAQQYLKSKMNKKKDIKKASSLVKGDLEGSIAPYKTKKKMGGGMMQRPMGYKGGGMDTGKVGEMKSRVTLAVDRLKKAKKFMGRGTGRLTDSDKEKIKSLVGKGQAIRPIKKMGGGMMNKPMSYNTGGPSAGFKSKQDRKKAEKNIKQARSKEGLRSFLSSGNKINQPMRKERYMEGRKARHTEFKKKIGRTALGIASSLNPVTSIAKGIGKVMGKGSKKRDFQKGDYGDISVKKNMGGMMMQRPMGYKSGTSVKVKCKLGKNKPTKMY